MIVAPKSCLNCLKYNLAAHEGIEMALDPNKKRLIDAEEFVPLDIEVSAYETGQTGPFSKQKHRYYTVGGLAGGFNTATPRIEYLLRKIAEISEQTGAIVPYAFRDRNNERWSIDAGCLDAIGPNHQSYVTYSIKNGYIVGVQPTPKMVEHYASASSVAADINEIRDDVRLSETEREQLIAARIGQGRFRRDVLASWHGKCAVTSCDLGAVLRASHILAWREADNLQRLDAENGLPLVATLDALFDVGLISFDDDGRLLCKPVVSNYPGLVDGTSRLSRPPAARMRVYLDRHRQQHGFCLRP